MERVRAVRVGKVGRTPSDGRGTFSFSIKAFNFTDSDDERIANFTNVKAGGGETRVDVDYGHLAMLGSGADPLATQIGTAQVRRVGDLMTGEAQLHMTNKVAQMVHERLLLPDVDPAYLGEVSVWFAYDPAKNTTANGVKTIHDAELLSVSVVRAGAQETEITNAKHMLEWRTPPWHIAREGGQYLVVADGTGDVEGRHDTMALAQAHLAALYANVPDKSETDAQLFRRLGDAIREARSSWRVDPRVTGWAPGKLVDAFDSAAAAAGLSADQRHQLRTGMAEKESFKQFMLHGAPRDVQLLRRAMAAEEGEQGARLREQLGLPPLHADDEYLIRHGLMRPPRKSDDELRAELRRARGELDDYMEARDETARLIHEIDRLDVAAEADKLVAEVREESRKAREEAEKRRLARKADWANRGR